MDNTTAGQENTQLPPASGQEQLEAVRRATQILREAFGGRHFSLMVYGENSIQLCCHGYKTYAEATEWLRSLGAGDRDKRVHDTYTELRGRIGNLEFITYPDELPPTCRKVTKIERVPKTQTVETGEFIEITREVIECGEKPLGTEVAAAMIEAKPMLEYEGRDE